MKRNFLMIAVLFAGLTFTSCGGGASELEKAAEDAKKEMNDALDKATDEAKEDAEAATESTSTVMYQCPDDCENGPAFFDAGPCKKCGKEMVEI